MRGQESQTCQEAGERILSFAQAGALGALQGPQEPVARMRGEFDRRRRPVQERLAGGLRRIGGRS